MTFLLDPLMWFTNFETSMSLGINPTYSRCITSMDRFYLLMYYIGFFNYIMEELAYSLFVAFLLLVLWRCLLLWCIFPRYLFRGSTEHNECYYIFSSEIYSHPPISFTLEWFPSSHTPPSYVVTVQCWDPEVPKPPTHLLWVPLLQE